MESVLPGIKLFYFISIYPPEDPDTVLVTVSIVVWLPSIPVCIPHRLTTDPLEVVLSLYTMHANPDVLLH